MVSLFLQKEGYTVLEASNAAEAIRLAKKRNQAIHLLLSDIIMPGMSGLDLAQHLIAHHKDMKVLYSSGYAGHPLFRHRYPRQGESFISKPFNSETLLRKVREALDAPLSKQ